MRYGIVDEYYENPAYACNLCGQVPRFCSCYEEQEPEPQQPGPEEPGPPWEQDAVTGAAEEAQNDA